MPQEGDPVFDSRWGLLKLSSDLILLSASRNFLGGKMRPASRTDNTATLAVPNVQVRMDSPHSISPQSLHDLLAKPLPLPLRATNPGDRGGN